MDTLLRVIGALLVAILVAVPTDARPAAAQPAGYVCDGSPGVYLYAGLNFTGRCLRLVADEPDLSALGFNNVASSLRVVGVWAATLYADQNYASTASTFTADDENLIDDAIRQDRASSIRVWPGATPGGYRCDGSAGVYLYDLAGFGGRCLRLVADEPDLSALGFDNAASSVAVVGEWTATLYVDQSYSKLASTFTANDSDLADNRVGSDQASSLRVQRGRVDPALACDGGEGVYLYDEEGYVGRCIKLVASQPDLGASGFDNAAASTRVVGPWEATLFRDLAYAGIGTDLAADTPDLRDTPLGARQATSIQVRRVSAPPGLACDGGAGVYLYQDPDYRGRCLKFTADAPDLRAYDFDDLASSVRAVGTYDATLYRDSAYTGPASRVFGDDPNLGDDTVGDNQVSSLRVREVAGPPGLTCDGGPGVYLYQDPGYTGRCLKLTADAPDLRAYGFDDLASSVRMAGGYRATLYGDLGYTGPASAFSRDEPNLANDSIGDNRASSVQVQRAVEPPALACDGGPGVYLYQDPGYTGRCLKFTVDAPDLRAYGFDDLASSVRTVGAFAVTLYRDLSFTGAATVVEGADVDLADTAVGDNGVTSVQVRRSDLPAALICEGEGVYLYQDPQYQGPCRKLTADVPDLRLYSFDDVASSVRIVGPYSAQLHADLAFRGPWTGFRGDDPNLADDSIGDNRTTSVQVQRR